MPPSDPFMDQICERLHRLSREAVLEKSDGFRLGVSWARNDAWMSIYGAAVAEYFEILQELTSKLNDRLPSFTIETAVQDSLHSEAYQEPNSGRAVIEKLCALHETSNGLQTVYLPVEGLQLEVDRFAIGRVRFVRLEGSQLDELYTSLEAIASTIADESNRKTYTADRKRDVDEHLANKVCAVFSHRGAPQRVAELAEIETRRALEAITFAHVSMYLYSPWADAIAAIEGQKPRAKPWTMVIANLGTWFIQESPRQHWPILISEASLQQMSQAGLGEISRMLSSQIATEVETAVLQAVHWLADSVWRRDNEGSAVSLFTALESIIPDKMLGSSTATIATATARIVSHSPEAIERNRATIKTYWDKRGKLVHGHHREFSEGDRNHLRAFVVRTISTILTYLSELGSFETLKTQLQEDPSNLYLRRLVPRPFGAVFGTGPSLRYLRVRAGLSAEDLATQIGPWRTAENVERWERSVLAPSFIDLLRITQALEVRFSDIDFHSSERLIEIHGHVFLLHCHPTKIGGVARVYGRSWENAKCDLELASETVNGPSEPLGYVDSWRIEGEDCKEALDKLEALVFGRVQEAN